MFLFGINSPFRTQSIVSVSDAVPVASGSKLRRRRNTKEKLIRHADPKPIPESKESTSSDKQSASEKNGSVSSGRRNLGTDYSDGTMAATPKKSPSKSDSSFRKRLTIKVIEKLPFC